MTSFFRCWLPKKDYQVWLRCERKLWSENNSTSFWLHFNQKIALVKEIFSNSESNSELSVADVCLVKTGPYIPWTISSSKVQTSALPLEVFT